MIRRRALRAARRGAASVRRTAVACCLAEPRRWSVQLRPSQVVAGGAGAILAIPLVIQQLCGGLSGLPTGVRVSAVLAALLATACAALNAASFGLIYESSLRDSFISGWNHGSTKIGDETVSLVAGNTDAMNAAAGAAGFALLAAIVIVITSCCCGSSKSEDSVKSALLKS